MGLAELTHGKKWKNFMAKLYGWGASVVIIGALFKIQHWAGAGVMLTVGLGTEAVIFFFSAFEPPHEDPDWSLVYPELAGMPSEGTKGSGSITEDLDNMLEEAKIGPELLESVSTGLKALGDNTAKLADLTDASVATNDYVKNVKGASESVNELSQSYNKASLVINELAASSGASSGDVRNYNEQMAVASKNLSALNAVYELQLQDSNSQLKTTAKLYEGIKDLMSNLNESINDTKQYKEEVAQLAKNLSALNTIYGNMLSAMTSGNRG